MVTDHVGMDYELKAPPTQSRAFTGGHRTIVYFWITLWTGLMVWLFNDLNNQVGGWFDGPGFAAIIAGFGLIAGLVTLGIVVGAIRLAITDRSIRTLCLVLFPSGLLVLVIVALSG